MANRIGQYEKRPMRILVVAPTLPKPDQKSGDVRLVRILECLAQEHDVTYAVMNSRASTDSTAWRTVVRLGIRADPVPVVRLLRTERFDLVIFEFYFTAERYLQQARLWQSGARIIVDSVDVHFARLRLKASLTKSPGDEAEADEVLRREVAVYHQADAVIVVSKEDEAVLRAEGIQTPMFLVPNIHEMYAMQPQNVGARVELIFVGNFLFPPNLDGIKWFCNSIYPLVRSRLPATRLRLVGAGVTPEVEALAGAGIEIVGYVPQTTAYLQSSDISIAPLRYGGGVKGKVGEAMAHGLPVVTTSIGAQGFYAMTGMEMLIADEPEAFADAIHRLSCDRELYQAVRSAGWNYVESRFSPRAVFPAISAAVREVAGMRAKSVGIMRKIAGRVPVLIDRYVGWRLRGVGSREK